MMRVVLPFHLRRLARVEGDVSLELSGPATRQAVLDALEARYPTLRGTLRDPSTGQTRPMIRFYAMGKDWTHQPAESLLPDAVASGVERLYIVGAISGG